MAKLRSTVRKVQLLENRAAEKAGVRFLLLDEAQIVGAKRNDYIAGYVDMAIRDIGPGVLEAAKIGKDFFGEVAK